MVKIRLKRRLPGDRAGLTRTSIALAAAKQIETGGEDAVSMRELARSLGVAPTTISSHFKGGLADLEDEVVRVILADVAPPFRPLQTPTDYLEQMFLAALKTLQGRPTLAMLTILRMTRNPLVVPDIAERSLAGLAAMGVAPDNIGTAYRETLQIMFGLILGGPARAYLVPKAEERESTLLPSTLVSREYRQIFAYKDVIFADLSGALTWTPDTWAIQTAVGRLAGVLATLTEEEAEEETLVEE